MLIGRIHEEKSIALTAVVSVIGSFLMFYAVYKVRFVEHSYGFEGLPETLLAIIAMVGNSIFIILWLVYLATGGSQRNAVTGIHLLGFVAVLLMTTNLLVEV